MTPAWPLLLALVLVAGAGPALADHAPEELAVADHRIEEPIEPLGEPARFHLQVTVPCTEDESAVAWTTLELATRPSWLRWSSPGAENETTSVCQDPSDHLMVGVPVDVRVTQHAPAFQETGLAVEVEVQKNHTDGNVTHLGPASATVTLTPGYFNLYNVRLEHSIAQVGPQEAVAYPILIDNYSNGPTRFEFTVAEPSSLPDGFRPVAPAPLVLGSNVTGEEPTNGTVPFTVYTPFHNGYVNDVAAIQLEVRSYYAPNTSLEGASSTVSTITQARGWYVPGPGAVLVLAVIGASALASAVQRRQV